VSVRLYVPPERLGAGDVEIEGDDHHYLFRVRRLECGAGVVLFDGRGHEATAVVQSIEASRAVLQVAEVVSVASVARPPVTVLLALIKGERMDWCVQKLAELGVQRVLPVQVSRCVVRLDGDRARNRQRRWQKIAREAARQSQSDTVPDIAAPSSLEEALATAAEAALKLVFWERVRERSLRNALPATPPESIAVLLGPEGGLSPEEVDRALASGFLPVGLGPRVLRAETAAIAAVAALGFAFGDLG